MYFSHSPFTEPYPSKNQLTDLRGIGLIRRPSSRQVRSMLLKLPRALASPQQRVFGGGLVNHVGHPSVPTGFDVVTARKGNVGSAF